MEAVGKTVQLTIAQSKNRKVFRECTVTEYVQTYDGSEWSYYWACLDDEGRELSFDWHDIVNGVAAFLPN